MPESVDEVGSYAFHGCSKITQPIYTKTMFLKMPQKFNGAYKVPEGIIRICEYAFYECSNLTSVSLPSSLNIIDSESFEDCKGLKQIVIPEGTIEIGNRAFYGCSGLTSLEIPNSIKTIDAYAFTKCDNLSTIYWNANLEIRPFEYIAKAIKEVYFGDQVTSVYYTFADCSNLEKVVLGKNVSALRSLAFKATGLKKLYITGDMAPNCYVNAFLDTDLSSATLYVPERFISQYQIKQPWNSFGNLLTLEGNEPDIPSQSEQKQCDQPTITYENGILHFSTSTPNAIITRTIQVPDAGVSVGDEMTLSATYNITAIATCDGYLASEPVYATLYWLDASLDVSDTMESLTAGRRGILVTTHAGQVTLKGVTDGEIVEMYDLKGRKLTASRARGTTIVFNAEVKEIVILKVGDNRIKVSVN